MPDAITREEKMLSAIANGSAVDIAPITRKERFLAYIGGQDVTPPSPITREEILLSKISPNGGVSYPNAEEAVF